MSVILLNGFWQGKCFTEDHSVDFCFEGTVPGCVHTDLRGIKIHQDIDYRDNADKCTWIETRDLEYSRTFILQDLPSTATLIFEGLDVYTDIYVNGKYVGSTDNMFIPHRFAVADFLKKGENHISVYCYSPIKKVDGLPLCDAAFTRERMRTRRIQCTYGWDWVGRFVTSGIFRDVYLECSNGIDVENVYIYTENVDSFGAQIYTEMNFK
jgi:beta-mannosidase